MTNLEQCTEAIWRKEAEKDNVLKIKVEAEFNGKTLQSAAAISKEQLEAGSFTVEKIIVVMSETLADKIKKHGFPHTLPLL